MEFKYNFLMHYQITTFLAKLFIVKGFSSSLIKDVCLLQRPPENTPENSRQSEGASVQRVWPGLQLGRSPRHPPADAPSPSCGPDAAHRWWVAASHAQDWWRFVGRNGKGRHYWFFLRRIALIIKKSVHIKMHCHFNRKKCINFIFLPPRIECSVFRL